MLIRIVKLTFHKNHVNEFLSVFENSKNEIRNTSGCRLLELYRDKTDDTIFFTYSHWETEKDLENYRNSAFFKEVWSKTKVLFSDKPQAWSVDKLDDVIKTTK